MRHQISLVEGTCILEQKRGLCYIPVKVVRASGQDHPMGRDGLAVRTG